MKNILFALLLSSFATISWAQQQEGIKLTPEFIKVVGYGEIEEEPDQVILNVSIEARKKSLLEAKKAADEKYHSVLSVLKKNGIKDNLIKATHINTQPQYEWEKNKRVYKGELVSRALSIKVNDLDKVSPLMQALVENGVSTIDNIEAGFQDLQVLQQKALQAAADNARDKAEFLVQRLGRNLGAAYMIFEQHIDLPRPYELFAINQRAAKAKMAELAPPPEMFGLKKVKATIDVHFYLN